MKRIIIILLTILFLFSIAYSEENNEYKINSEFFKKVTITKVLTIYDSMMIDIDNEAIFLCKAGLVDGEFYFPSIPADLEYVILFDGYHFVSSSFTITSSSSIHVWFIAADVCDLIRTSNIYLFLIN